MAHVMGSKVLNMARQEPGRRELVGALHLSW